MLLTDQQWAQLEAIFSRIQLDVSGRQALLIPIARSVGMNVAESPFAIWLTIAGARDFFVIMRNVIQTAEEPSLEKALLVGLKSNALNLEDKSTLTSWLESPSQHKRTGSFTITEDVIGNLSISHDEKMVLARLLQLFQRNPLAKEQIANTAAWSSTMKNSTPSVSDESNNQQFDLETRTRSDRVENHRNSGLEGENITVNGSVTINNYPEPPPKSRSPANVNSRSFSGASSSAQEALNEPQSMHRSTYYRDREMIAREINQEFDRCPALAHSLESSPTANDVKEQVIEQFANGERPADWLLDRVIERYNYGKLASDDLHRGLKRLLILSLIVQMPPDVHELLSMEILRVKSDDSTTTSQNEVVGKDVGTRDRQFITLSIATAVSATSSDLKSNDDFLIDIVQELMDDDWSQKLATRHSPCRIKPFDFSTEEKRCILEPPAIKSRNLDENLRVLSKDLLDAFGQTCYPSQPEIDVLNTFLNTFSKPHDLKLQLFALILPVEYFQNLISSIRVKIPKLLVIPVSNRRDEEFQHLRMILDQTTRILDSARQRK
jgi:hypothetical protein